MGFQHLPDVHARRHAQRVEHNLHRSPVLKERHVLLGDDLGDHTLVSVAARHLVTDRKLALGGDVNLDGLDDAGVNPVTRLGPFNFLVILHLQVVELLFEAADDFVDLVPDRRRVDFDAVVNRREFA